jgi:hypothetical protein
MKCAFNIAYYIAKHNKPYTDTGGLLALADKLGVEVRREHSKDMRCAESASHIAEVLKKDLICKLQKQKYVSLLFHASTVKAVLEDLILYVRQQGRKSYFISHPP